MHAVVRVHEVLGCAPSVALALVKTDPVTTVATANEASAEIAIAARVI